MKYKIEQLTQYQLLIIYDQLSLNSHITYHI